MMIFCLMLPAVIDGNWIVLTSRGIDSKPLLAALQDGANKASFDELAKKYNFEDVILEDGTTFMFPATKNERARRKLQIAAITKLSKTVGKWTSADQLPEDLKGFVNAQVHSQSGSQSVSLVPMMNVSIGKKKTMLYDALSPQKQEPYSGKVEPYVTPLGDPYSLASCSFTVHSSLVPSVVGQAKTIELAGKVIEDLFKELDKELADAIEKSFASNDSYTKRMQELTDLSGRKVKDLPPELQQFLLNQCYSRDSGVSLGDIGDSMFNVDNKGYALGVQASFDPRTIYIFPIKSGGA